MENETNVNTNQSSVLKVSEVPVEPTLNTIQVLEQSVNQVTNQVPNYVTNQVTNQVPVNIELSLEDVYVNLRLISKINQGEKLLQQNKYINIDTSYFQLVTRWFRGAGRTESIDYIQKILYKAFEFSDKLIEDKTEESAQKLLRLNTDLKNSLEGLTNLKITYMYDKLIQSEIDVMIDNVRSKLDLNNKHLNFNKPTTNDKTEVRSNDKTEVRSNDKTEVKSNDKTEVKSNEKIEVKSNEKTEVKLNDKHKKSS